MINVSVQIRGDGSLFEVMICAESIIEALNLAEARYPGGEPQLVYPIEPETFFVTDPPAASVVELVPERAAG